MRMIEIEDGDMAILEWALGLGRTFANFNIQALHSTDDERELGRLRLAAIERIKTKLLVACDPPAKCICASGSFKPCPVHRYRVIGNGGN